MWQRWVAFPPQTPSLLRRADIIHKTMAWQSNRLSAIQCLRACRRAPISISSRARTTSIKPWSIRRSKLFLREPWAPREPCPIKRGLMTQKLANMSLKRCQIPLKRRKETKFLTMRTKWSGFRSLAGTKALKMKIKFFRSKYLN